MSHKIATLDIGSSKTTCIIAIHHSDGSISIEGIGYTITKGVKKGAITDIRAVQKSIVSAVNKAEKMADTTIQSVVVTIPETLTQSEYVRIELHIKGKEITKKEVTSLLDIKKQYYRERKIIHVIPLTYQVDEMKDLDNPIGMVGNILLSTMNVISISTTTIENLIKCISYCHLDIKSFVISPFATGIGTLLEDELNHLGAVIIDIGAETTEYASFARGKLIDTGHIALGGENITSDIAKGLNISLDDAERIKIIYGNTYLCEREEQIQIKTIGDLSFTKFSSSTLSDIIKPRVEEILGIIKDKLDRKGYIHQGNKRIVLTGGSSNLSGIKNLTEDIFQKQVRIGKPKTLKGLTKTAQSPAFTAPVGAIHYTIYNLENESIVGNQSILSKVASFFGNI